MNEERYIVIGNCFYKKGMILVKGRNNCFAPSLDDYNEHCHFLKHSFIIERPLVYKKI